MDPIELLILAALGGAAYLFFSTPSSSVSSQSSPTPTTAAEGGAPAMTAAQAAAIFAQNTTTALNTIWANASHGNSSPTFQSFLQQGIAARSLPAPTMQNASTNCQTGTMTPGTTASTAKYGTAAVGIGTSVAVAAGAAAGSIVPIVGTAIGAALGLISALFGAAHEKAEQEQDQAICEGVNAANSAYSEIDAYLAGGELTAAQAVSAYGQIQSQFTSVMKTNTSYKTGDALWGFDLCNQAIVAARMADVNAGVLTGGVPAPWVS